MAVHYSHGHLAIACPSTNIVADPVDFPSAHSYEDEQADSCTYWSGRSAEKAAQQGLRASALSTYDEATDPKTYSAIILGYNVGRRIRGNDSRLAGERADGVFDNGAVVVFSICGSVGHLTRDEFIHVNT